MIIRKHHRKFAMHLNDRERFEVASALMNGETPKSIAARFRCSLTYITHIKYEFLEVHTVWKPGVLDKYKGSTEPVQQGLIPKVP